MSHRRRSRTGRSLPRAGATIGSRAAHAAAGGHPSPARVAARSVRCRIPVASSMPHRPPQDRLEAFRELLEPGPQLGAEVLPIRGELNDGLDVVDAVARIVTASSEDDTDDAGSVGIGREFLQRIRELDLAALAGSVRSRISKTDAGRTYRPMMARLDGASSCAGFSTRPVTRTAAWPSIGSTAAAPYMWMLAGSTSISAITAAPEALSARRSCR